MQGKIMSERIKPVECDGRRRETWTTVIEIHERLLLIIKSYHSMVCYRLLQIAFSLTSASLYTHKLPHWGFSRFLLQWILIFSEQWAFMTLLANWIDTWRMRLDWSFCFKCRSFSMHSCDFDYKLMLWESFSAFARGVVLDWNLWKYKRKVSKWWNMKVVESF